MAWAADKVADEDKVAVNPVLKVADRVVDEDKVAVKGLDNPDRAAANAAPVA